MVHTAALKLILTEDPRVFLVIGLHDLQPGDTISRGRTVKIVRNAWTEGDRSFVRFL